MSAWAVDGSTSVAALEAAPTGEDSGGGADGSNLALSASSDSDAFVYNFETSLLSLKLGYRHMLNFR